MEQQIVEVVEHQAGEPMRHPHIPPQAHTDEGMVSLWLNGRTPHTQRAYAADAGAFLAFVGVPLRVVTVSDVQRFGASLLKPSLVTRRPLSPATRARRLGSVKSLIAYAHHVGYVAFDVGAPVELPKVKDTLAQRIIGKDKVKEMLRLETNQRNHALLRLLYVAGLRISEACGLRWHDAIPREQNGETIGGQITVMGKGGKTGAVLLPPSMWTELEALRGDAQPTDPVFLSAKGWALDPSQAHRIVKAAAARTPDVPPALSAHWLRHAHASHALDNNAPLSLVQATLRHSNVATTSRYLHARPNDSSAMHLGE